MRISLKVLIEVLKEQNGEKIIAEAVYRSIERKKQVDIFTNVWPKELTLKIVGIDERGKKTGSKLAQVKAVKEFTGLSLIEAKKAVDAYYEGNETYSIPLITQVFSSRVNLESFVEAQLVDYGLIITL